MAETLPGQVVDTAPLIREIDFSGFAMRVSTDRYHSAQWAAREREGLWSRVWQVAGRAGELAEPGDWKEYRLFDQSWLIVRGRDGRLRGFVNACRHRGNRLCRGEGHDARFTCLYHNWSYGLDGTLLAVARPDFAGSLEDFVGDKAELGLREVPVETFAGFVFLNPDPAASPLAEFLGETMALLAPYRLEEMTPVGLDVRESLNCNWKVVMDAFQEGYHIQGVHPELVPAMDESQERYFFPGDHSVATAPFGAANLGAMSVEAEISAIHGLTATFPGVADVLPRLDELAAGHTGADGRIVLPGGVTARTLLQQATRETLSAKGLDVSGLTDAQMSDNHFFLIFPNLFITIRAGEATVITSTPHPDGDPNRCHWHVTGFMWLPPEQRPGARIGFTDVPEGEHFPYFLALEQDWEMMQRQQDGLRQSALGEMALTRQEVRLAWYHAVLDRWVKKGAAR